MPKLRSDTRSGAWQGLFLIAPGLLAAAAVAAAAVTGVLGGSRAPFTVAASPATRSITRGQMATYAITIKRNRGFNARVGLSVSGLPRPAASRLAFNPRSNTRATLRVTTSSATPIGTFHPVVRAARGKQSATMRLTLAVNKPGNKPVAFGISGNVTGLTPGSPGSIDLSLNNPYGSAILITGLKVSVTSVTAPNATPSLPCTQADFATQQYSGVYPITVPATSTLKLSQLGVTVAEQPQEILLPRQVDQDGCQGAKLTLVYSGTAVSG